MEHNDESFYIPVDSCYEADRFYRKQTDELKAKITRLTDALKLIADWKPPRVKTPKIRNGELTGEIEEVSYSYAYGSNGERDYFRKIANDAMDWGASDYKHNS